MKLKYRDGLFFDDVADEFYYIDITFPLRVLAIFPDAPECNKDVTYLWAVDEHLIQENIDNGIWVEFE
jgi:hypothetical protein